VLALILVVAGIGGYLVRYVRPPRRH
jgi:hypothetical protein